MLGVSRPPTVSRNQSRDRDREEGKESTDASDLETKWREKHAKRQGPTFAWEGVDVTTDHLKALSRQAEASVWLMRKLLGDEKAMPCVKKIIAMTDKTPYHRYIDDFVEAPADTIKLLKKTGGTQNLKREEFAQFAWTKGANWHDHVVAHSVAEFMLAPALDLKDYDAPPAWLKESVGCFVEYLFRGSVKASCITIPSGTGAGDVTWDEASKWDASLQSLVARGRDPSMLEVVSVTLNAMNGAHRAKAASVIRFLALRRPGWFRDVVASLKKNPKDPKAALESGLGLTLDELDEFWRRWIRAQWTAARNHGFRQVTTMPKKLLAYCLVKDHARGPHGEERLVDEEIVVQPVDGNVYRLRAAPFFAKGLAVGDDIVALPDSEGKLRVDCVVARGGHSTFWIGVPQAKTEACESYWEPLQALGCSSSRLHRGRVHLIAVDIPRAVNFREVLTLMRKGKNDGVWDVEEGFLGHSLE